MTSKSSAALMAIFRLVEAAEKHRRGDLPRIPVAIVENAKVGLQLFDSMLQLMPDPGEVGELMTAIYTHQRKTGDLTRQTLRLKQVALQVDAALDACVGRNLVVDMPSIDEARDVLLLAQEHVGRGDFTVTPGDLIGPMFAGATMTGAASGEWKLEVALTRGLPDDDLRGTRWHLCAALRPQGEDDDLGGCNALTQETEEIWDSIMPKDAAHRVAGHVRRLLGVVNGHGEGAPVLQLVSSMRRKSR